MNKISLIMTVYNRVSLLRKALISLANQSVMPDELIISDDGSTEDVLGGIQDLIKQFPFDVKHVNQQNKGFRLARVRNNGVRIASGDLLLFLDQDIILTKDYIKTFAEHKKEKRFLTSYPIRLSEEQSEQITETVIKEYDFLKYIKQKQRNKIKSQYIKDYTSFIKLKIGLENQKPKLRGGVCAINREDYYFVNGYDEKFQGWGNEDDDIRKRMYKAGITGFNPFIKDFPLHLYHEPNHNNGERVNQEYVKSKSEEIKTGKYRCDYGIENSLDEDQPVVTIL